MFGSLKKYVKDPETFQKSKYFWILTPQRNLQYEIFSAYTTAVDGDTYTFFPGPGAEYTTWQEKMLKNSEIKTDVQTLTMQDRVVTLSTCTGDYSTRFVVQGKLSGIEELTSETFEQMISRKAEEKRIHDEQERKKQEKEAALRASTADADSFWNNSGGALEATYGDNDGEVYEEEAVYEEYTDDYY